MRKTISSSTVAVQGRSGPFKARSQKGLLAKRDSWLRRIDFDHSFHCLFDAIPGLYFFAKNCQGEFMFMSRGYREIYHIPNEMAVIGLKDFDLNPPDMAQTYGQDDERVCITGRPLLNHVQLGFDDQGIPDWFQINKVPVWSASGKIAGIMGFFQAYEERAELLQPFKAISRAVNHLRQNYAQDISVRELADLAGLSVRQLERKFKAAFGVTPQRFLIKTRLLAACRALRQTAQGMAEIAFACGFRDPSAFARHFRMNQGMSPSEFRHRRKED
jgi:AraC-like DNA-binding protein